MYQFDSRVRFSEVNQDSIMDLYSVINYFQDCSCFQSEDLGNGVTDARLTHCAWLIDSWQIIVNRYPVYTEDITVGTWAYGFDRVCGYRNYIIKSKSGEILAIANSKWIYVDTNAGRILKLPKEVVERYPIEPRLEGLDYERRKIVVPKAYEEYEPFTIQLSELDSNHHVNNGQYIRFAQQYIPEDFKIWKMSAEYKRQAILGDTMIPRITLQDSICTVTFVNKEALPYCVIEFMQAPVTHKE